LEDFAVSMEKVTSESVTFANLMENLLIVQLSELEKVSLGLGTHLFVKVPRPGDSEGTFSVFESSCHLVLLITNLTLKGRGNPVECLAQRHNMRACRPNSIFTVHTFHFFYADRQAGKL